MSMSLFLYTINFTKFSFFFREFYTHWSFLYLTLDQIITECYDPLYVPMETFWGAVKFML